MREIKFRAWDTLESKMIESEDLAAQQWNVLLSITENERSNWRFMQFTGLLDKNGKEIYEGDIVKGETLIPMKVIWHKYQWAVEYYPYEGKTIETIDDGLLKALQDEDFQIIGNIYENPELLN